ncbi:ATP-binding protein [Nocardia tengchongensis]|uniref:ATP-binding protein n=1 Tax=Nocardia tengchongensis TaxID=2055889 RepID=UPI0036818D37
MSQDFGSFEVGIPKGDDGFLGRSPDLARVITAMAASPRLVTLLGPGGIGKTRLALAAADQLRASHAAQVHCVHLARLAPDAAIEDIANEIVTAATSGDFSAKPVRQTLIEVLGRADANGQEPPSILVLDNCEHVLTAVGALIAELLHALPRLVILATSRTAIGWVDERIISIPPLSREHAVVLFSRRAELAGRPVSNANLALVEKICRHLHYHPLHIRLAAARLRYQPLPMILRDLEGDCTDRRLRWSPSFRVGVDERHRDINAVIAWSYELCGPKEQQLFERMSVFAAGYDINPADGEADRVLPLDIGADVEAIQKVCADSGTEGLSAAEIPRLLEQLADRSLVTLHVTPLSTRYSLLESFRLFAYERLTERRPSAWCEMSQRHLRHYHEKVRTLHTGWGSPGEQQLLERTRADWDNITSAIGTSLHDPTETRIGIDMAAVLINSRLPFLHGCLRESRRLAERSLAAIRQHGNSPVELEAAACASLGWLSLCQGLPDDAERLLRKSIALVESSSRCENPAVEMAMPPAVDYLAGNVLLLIHGDPRATAVLARARAGFDAVGDHGGAEMAALFEALSAALHGSAAQALRVTERHLDQIVATSSQWGVSWALLARAIALAAHGDPHEALEMCATALAWHIPIRDQWGSVWGGPIRVWVLAYMIDNAPESTTRSQRVSWATRLAAIAGGAAEIRKRIGVDLTNLRPLAEKTDQAMNVARKVLGSKLFDESFRRGEQIPEEALYAVALDVAHRPTADGSAATSSDTSGWLALTGAEREVAVLAAAGMTNTAIAGQRGTSTRTVDAQIAAILSKLMISSRREIAARLPLRNNLPPSQFGPPDNALEISSLTNPPSGCGRVHSRTT